MVPFPLDEVVWDYHLLPAQGLEREAVLVAIKAEDLDSLNDEITSHGLSTGKVDCTQTSLYNAYVDSYPEEKGARHVLDIGCKSTDLSTANRAAFSPAAFPRAVFSSLPPSLVNSTCPLWKPNV